MKYTGYTKAELIEWCQCLEHNYNIEKERFEGVSSIAQKEANEIVKLRGLLKECQCYIVNTPVLEQGSEQKTKQIQDLLTRINDVLGENVANNVAKPNSQHSEPNCNIMLKILKILTHPTEMLKGTTDD